MQYARPNAEKMLAGELYDPLDAELVAARERARDLCQALNATREADAEERRRILIDLFGAGGDRSGCSRRSTATTARTSFSASASSSTSTAWSSTCARCAIGDFTMFGPAVQIYTATHPLDAELRRKQRVRASPSTIGSDVWVGGGAIICPGVTIGSRSVIGAGSVVTRDIPDDVLAAGNPCRIIRSTKSG